MIQPAAKTIDDPNRRTLISVIRRTAQAMAAELVERLHAAGYPHVTNAYHPLFENIDPEGTRLTILAARAEMTHQSMGELVGALERRGYVERRPDPTDGRARLVCLTPAGRRLASKALREIAQIEREWLALWRDAGYEGHDLRRVLRAGLRSRQSGAEPREPVRASTRT